MGTITITSAGFGITPTVNGTKTYTVSDADMQTLLTWAAQFYKLGPSPTNQQILLAWIGAWIAQTQQQIQASNTVTNVPAQIGIS